MKTKKVTLRIDTTNAAFCGESLDAKINCAYEVARILRAAADRITEDGESIEGFNLRDSNGNTVGELKSR